MGIDAYPGAYALQGGLLEVGSLQGIGMKL